ncbi:MAG: hypothetical protein JWQ09_4793 [Segetibacter sp.]|nr:hypothetical protein [Segetibacter sp.]
MKKIILSLFSAIVILSACRKDDSSVFNKTPDERLNDTLSSYQSVLAAAENGWKAFVTVDSGRGATYSFYFKFNNQNRVQMVGDIDSASAATLKESSFRLKALQQPSLVFDTYSYLHVLSDPDASKNGGTYGLGLVSDFEFLFTSVTADTIKLTGRMHGSKAVLIKATKAEGDAYSSGRFILFSSYLNKIFTYFKRFTLGNVQYDIKVNSVTHNITFSWLDASGNLHSFTTTYYNVLGGVVLTNPLVVSNTLSINTFTNAVWDPNSFTISLTASGTSGTITRTVLPLKIDVTAPRDWWQRGVIEDNYWSSLTGFHVNGVDDAFGIQTLNRFYSLIYYPGYATNSNDLFGPVFINAAGTSLDLLYGAAPAKPTFTSSGLARFTLLGTYGTYPTSGPAFLSLRQLLLAEGYYFVRTGSNSYDMISAKDGQTWISWQW